MHYSNNACQITKGQKLINDLFSQHPCQYLSIAITGVVAKTSVASYITNILIAGGYTVGNFASTFINHQHEQISINNKPIDIDIFNQIKTNILLNKSYSKRINSALFLALIAHYYFTNHKVDIVLFEINNNDLEFLLQYLKPYVKIITTPSKQSLIKYKIDYAKYLILGPTKINQSILPELKSLTTKALIFKHDYNLIINPLSIDVTTLERKFYALPLPNIRTSSQMQNIAVAIATLSVIIPNYPINNAAIKQGIINTSLFGKFQLLNTPAPIIIDCAHNKQALTAMIKNMVKLPFNANNIAVFTWEKFANLNACIKLCSSLFTRWYIAKSNDLNSLEIEQIVAIMIKNNINIKNIYQHLTINEAFMAADNYAAQFEPKARIVCFGSNLMIKEILPKFDSMRK
jgi:dihydrofolate synthase/folylpolyglutamate synthase